MEAHQEDPEFWTRTYDSVTKNLKKKKGELKMDEPIFEEYEMEDYKEMRKKYTAMERQIQMEEAQKTSDDFMNRAWVETLKDEGLTPEEYAQLAVLDPLEVQQEIKGGMQKLVRKIKSRKGRKPAQPGQPSVSKPVNKVDIEEAKARGNVNAVLTALLPDDDPLMRY